MLAGNFRNGTPGTYSGFDKAEDPSGDFEDPGSGQAPEGFESNTLRFCFFDGRRDWSQYG